MFFQVLVIIAVIDFIILAILSLYFFAVFHLVFVNPFVELKRKVTKLKQGLFSNINKYFKDGKVLQR